MTLAERFAGYALSLDHEAVMSGLVGTVFVEKPWSGAREPAR